MNNRRELTPRPNFPTSESENLCFLLTGVGKSPSRDFLQRFFRLSPSVKVVLGGLESSSPPDPEVVRVKLFPNTHPNYLAQILTLVVEQEVTDILPLIDSEVVFLQRHRGEIENLGVRVWVGRSSDAEILSNKFQTYSQASSLAPVSRLVLAPEEFVPAIRDLGYPEKKLAVKPNSGVNGSGKGFRILDETVDSVTDTFMRSQPSRSMQARTYFRAMIEAEKRGSLPEILVTEFLSGQEYSCYVSADRGDVIEIGIHAKLGYEEGTTNTGHALLVQDDRVEEVCKTLARLFCLDFLNNIQLREDQLGRLRLLEINPRLAGTILLSEKGGIPLIESALSTARGEAWPVVSKCFDPIQIERLGVEVFSSAPAECDGFEVCTSKSGYLVTEMRSNLLSKLDEYASVIFDLDNTLIDEAHFLATAMRAFLTLQGTNEDQKLQYLSLLDKVYSRDGNHLLYDKILLEDFGREKLPVFLRILRSPRTEKDVRFLPGREVLLDALNGKGKKLFLVTDGNLDQQKAKISMLNISKYIKPENIVFADQYGGKPNVECASTLMPFANPSVVVGDSEVDLAFAKAVTADFVRIVR